MASFLTPIAIFAILLGACSSINLYHLKSETDLRRHLFSSYDKLVRPVEKVQNKITLKASMTPLYLRDLDEKNQMIILDAWVTMQWNDEYLTWQPHRFGNLSVLRIPPTEVWKPDLANYNAPKDTDMFPVADTNALIYNTGSVLWVPLFQIKGRCPIAKTKKVVTCSIKFGSWTFSEFELDLELYAEKPDMTRFSDNNHEWKLVDIKADRVSKYYPCCKEPYPYIEYNITFKRRQDSTLDNSRVLEEETAIILDV